MAAVTTQRESTFEGPVPRPMDRAHVAMAPDGQIVVDVGRL